MTPLPPWHRHCWRQVAARLEARRVPHALLLCGPRGLGKHRFAEHLAQALLCEAPQPEGNACGGCRPCHLYLAGTHPDCRRVAPLEEDKAIAVDQIRGLGDYLAMKSQLGGYKVAIIEPADRMTVNAANCLLKGLEEPPAGTVLILVSARPAWLPATVRSRCQRLLFGLPPRAEAAAWLVDQGVADPELLLTVAQGAPLAALALARDGGADSRRMLLDDLAELTRGHRDAVQTAAKWLKLNINLSLYWMYTWLVDMIRIKAASHPPMCSNPDYRPQLTQITKKMDIIFLFQRLDHLLEALRMADAKVNKQLLLEDLLLPWAPPAHRPPTP